MSEGTISVYQISTADAQSGRGSFGDNKTFYERFRDDMEGYVSDEAIDRLYHKLADQLFEQVKRKELCMIISERGCVGFASPEWVRNHGGTAE